MSDKAISVKVAVRVRPLLEHELAQRAQHCIRHPSNQQVLLGEDRRFTFDHVFSGRDDQDLVYSKAVAPLLEDVLKGYNITVLAYGQTGSGKTVSRRMLSILREFNNCSTLWEV